MIAAVFDCMVLLQALTNALGASGACLAFVEAGDVKLLMSAAILEETHDVLNRPNIRRSFPQLTDESTEDYIDHLLEIATIVNDVPLTHRLPQDPNDEPYLNLAVAAGASFIVTWDDDLLSLMNQAWFRTDYPSLSVVTPVTFLTHVRNGIEKKAG